MIFNLGDQFVYPSDTYDYGWYGILTIQRITENWVYLKSEYTGYDAEYRTFDDRDLKFPIDDFRGMVRRGKVLPYRENPAKCNDGSFSNSPHNSKGTCTWHEGVKGSATQSEYDASQMRVRYRSPKGYTGAFAPKKGKSATKPKPKARTQRKTQRRTQVYAIDVKSFNAQYDKSYKTKNNMGLVIAMALYDMGNREKSYQLPLVNFSLEDAYNVANMDYEDAKSFVVHNVLPQWERTYNVHQSEEWNENEIQEILNKYFDNVEKFFKNKRKIGQAKTILESNWHPHLIGKPRASSSWKKAVTKDFGMSGKGHKKFFQFGKINRKGNIKGGDYVDANHAFLTDGNLVCVIYAPMNPSDGYYEMISSSHSPYYMLTRNPIHSLKPFSQGNGFQYIYLK